jgi:CO/xanthine dehydrogenase FAD-binding subunit
MMTSQADVLRPRSLPEALDMRAAHPEAMPIAGGTDVMVFLEAHAIDPPLFMDLWALDGLVGIDETDTGLRIGASTTYTDLIGDPRVVAAAIALVEAAKTVGALQIQNRGTLGGNIANASPAGDTLPVLLALDAEVEVESAARGARRIPMDGLYTGYRALALEADELITAVHLPRRHRADRQHFRKVGTRLAQAISKVIFGGRVRIEDGVVTEARIALGSVAPTPVRARDVEAALVGSKPDPAAADAVASAISPIDDVRSTAEYRAEVARGVIASWLVSLA